MRCIWGLVVCVGDCLVWFGGFCGLLLGFSGVDCFGGLGCWYALVVSMPGVCDAFGFAWFMIVLNLLSRH